LDVGKFSWPFSPASRSDFTVQLVSGLFHQIFSTKKLVLNSMSIVRYSQSILFILLRQGSFFRAHHDTPRSEDMSVSFHIRRRKPPSQTSNLWVHVRWKSTSPGSSSSFNCLGGLLRWCRNWGRPCDIWSSYKHYIQSLLWFQVWRTRPSSHIWTPVQVSTQKINWWSPSFTLTLDLASIMPIRFERRFWNPA